ncbi:YifB family Mg chelatase-like AAA ATPase [Myxococcota bacterium]|nr:YifB family Mg chelatase-like AAA ATPase [Myxococcota bacterium]MBU1898520.1 YifB family Mg chelatase-like AAA ATPase [Myxococcota bacterium]
MLACISSAALIGVEAYRVEVEVDLGRGMLVFSTVGLPAGAVCEAKTRVKSALENCGYGFPQKRVTVNLAPAHIRKEGSAFDLPIALGILEADGKIPAGCLGDALILGELSLDGRVRALRGVLPLAAQAQRLGFKRLMVPADNAAEAAVVEGLEILAVDHLAAAVEALNGGDNPTPLAPRTALKPAAPRQPDLAEVKGQLIARRALEIAAAGQHNLLLIGPPGAGKTMLSRRLPSILAPMTFSERLEASMLASVAGTLRPDEPLLHARPFRAPHHTVSEAALTGGGPNSRPGEVSLAHHGVLFLDELPEFRRSALETLRQPLEDGEVTVSRAKQSLTYPAKFMLVASMNPCPCGYYGHPRRPCDCHPTQIQKYRARISGPLLDRIDLQVAIDPVDPKALRRREISEPSAQIAARVAEARQRQAARLSARGISCNAHMGAKEIREDCRLNGEGERLLTQAIDKLALSARAHDRILKVARTIADLAAAEDIAEVHLAEAIQYRQLDRAQP